MRIRIVRSMAWIVSFVVLLAPAAGVATAEDEESRPKLSMRMYRVQTLTHGRMPFGMQFPPVQEPGQPWEELPAVETSVPERRWHVGQADELIELVRQFVLPRYWEETEGADIRSLGEGTLVVRAGAGVQADVGRFLMDLERRMLVNVTLETYAVHLSAKARADLLAGTDGAHVGDARVAALLASGAAVAHARVVTENGTRAETFGGVQTSFLRAQRADVAEGAAAAAPLVGVANAGLALVARPTLLPRAQRVRVELSASLALASQMRSSEPTAGSRIELPSMPVLRVRCDQILHAGTWALLDGTIDAEGGASWVLLVRASPEQLDLPRRANPVSLDVPVDVRAGPWKTRMLDVSAMSRAPAPVIGSGAFLRDSRFKTGIEEEVPEGMPPLPQEALVELIMSAFGEARWEDPASIEVRNGTLIVRQTRAVHEAVIALVNRVEADRPAVITNEVVALEADAALLRKVAEAAGGSLMNEASRALLEAALAQGTARRRTGARVTSTEGARNTVRGGRDVGFIQTYEVKLAAGERQAEAVSAKCLSGLEVDLMAALSASGEAALIEARITQTGLVEPIRRVRTPHGELDLPALDTARVRTTLTVPLGRTAWVGTTNGPAGRQVMLLLTPRLQRRTAPR